MAHFLSPTLLNAFEAALYNEEKSTNTVQKYLRDLRCFARFAGGRPIDKHLILDYKTSLSQRYSLTSANSMLAALNSFFRFAHWEDDLVKRFRIQKKTYSSEAKELSKNDYDALVRTAETRHDKRMALLLQTICATGIRVSEVPFITLEAVRCGEAVVRCKGKVRTVFIVSSLRQKLLRYARKNGICSGHLFRTKTGRPMDRSNIWREMKALCVQAKVAAEKVFPHNLRHLFARTFYGIEKDIAKLADILGHSSIDTTRIYIVSTGAEHRKKLEAMRLIL